MRAITVVMCGVSGDVSDAVIQTHWSRYRSNVGHHRIAKATA
jgi:hypothetical protein